MKLLKDVDWKLVITCSFVSIVISLPTSLIVQKTIDDKHQCNSACLPFATIGSEKEYCICATNSANESKIIWRKDIK